MSAPATRQWVRVRALPPDLQIAARGLASARLRRHPDSKSRAAAGALALVVAGAAAVFGYLVATGSPGEPLATPLRWGPLGLAGLVLGAWLAWRTAGWVRPSSGQALLIGPASLVIVCDLAVEVLPAEELEICGDEVRFAGAVVDRDPGARWRQRLEESIARACTGAVDDPWRHAVDIAGQPERVPAGRARLAVGALLGVAAGLGLDYGLGATRPESAERWADVAGDLAAVEDTINAAARREHRHAFGDLEQALDAGPHPDDVRPLLVARRDREMPPALAERIATAIVSDANAAFDGGGALVELVPYLDAAASFELDPSLRERAAGFVAERAEDELLAITAMDLFPPRLVTVTEVLAPADVHARIRAHVTKLALKRADVDDLYDFPVWLIAELAAVGLDDVADQLRARFADKVRAHLPRAEAGELPELASAAEQLELPDLVEVIEARGRQLDGAVAPR